MMLDTLRTWLDSWLSWHLGPVLEPEDCLDEDIQRLITSKVNECREARFRVNVHDSPPVRAGGVCSGRADDVKRLVKQWDWCELGSLVDTTDNHIWPHPCSQPGGCDQQQARYRGNPVHGDLGSLNYGYIHTPGLWSEGFRPGANGCAWEGCG